MVQGLKSLERKLTRTIPVKVREATRKAMEQGADEIVVAMKRYVPVDTGRLRDSIGWTWGDAPDGSVIIGTSAAIGQGERITIFAGVRSNNNYDEGFYVRFVEFGTRNMHAQPFFFPAWRLKKKRVKGRITRAMKKAIREAAK